MLLFYLKPKNNESLTGFFYRTAKENLMDNIKWINDHFSVFTGYQPNVNLMNWGEQNHIKDTSNFLRIEYQLANSMTFTYLLEFHGLRVDYTKNTIKCPWFSYQTTKVCPVCLKEEPIHRLDWSFTYSFICRKHKLFLIDKCMYCSRDINIKTVISDKCVCGMPLSSAKPKNVTLSLLFNYQQEVDKFFSHDKTVNINDWISNSSTFYYALEFLATWIPQTINIDEIITLDGFKYSGNAVVNSRLKKSKTLIQSCPLYIHAYILLRDWPKQFYTFIRLMKNKNNLNSFRLFCNAVNKLIGTNLEPLHTEFMNYILKNQLPNSYPNQFISIKKACEITKLKEDTIKRSDFFQLFMCNFKEMEFFFVKKIEIEKWLSLYKESISKEHLRNTWRTSPKVTFNILSNNVLWPAINIQTGSVMQWQIPIGKLEEITLRLQQRTTLIIGPKIILNKAFQWVGVHYSFVVIKAMLAGCLPFELDKKVLGNSLVSKRVLFKIVRNIVVKLAKQSGVLSQKDVAFLFGVKKKDIEYWICTNRLKTNSSGAITNDSFTKFESKYFTTFQISMIKSISTKRILKKYNKGKLIAVSGPELNDGKRLLFLKSVINII
ncbi:TniQ family protein [Niallia sp. FSL W8-0951]|uniref:TniQ family protein n=1 Tax=Niallia sp. FSL W8-0951 TaxID=2954639 RepID=UPI0030F7125C